MRPLPKYNTMFIFMLSTALLLLSTPPISWSFLTPLWMVTVWALESRTGKASFILFYALQQLMLFSLLFSWLIDFSSLAFVVIGLIVLTFSILAAWGIKITELKLPVIFMQLLLVERLTVIPSIMLPGYWLYNYPFLIGSAATWGVLGLSFAIWSLSWLIFHKKYFISLLLLTMILLPGWLPRSHPPELKASLIQSRAHADIEDYFRLSKSADRESELLIWAETAIQTPLRNNWQLSTKLRNFVEKNEIALLFGNQDEQLFSGKYQPVYNTALLLEKNGVVSGIHYKNKLLPIMELANYQLNIPYFLRNNLSGGAYRPKQSQEIVSFQGEKLGVFICYEVFFPDLVKQIAADSLILINIASDGWNQSKIAHLINFIPNVFRAVENNHWLLRVSDTGYTAIISSRGEIVSKIELFAEGVLEFNPADLPAP